jgi:cytochrome P450
MPAEHGGLDERLTALFTSDPLAMADPFPLFRELRETGPVYDYGPMVLVTRHREVKMVWRDTTHFSNRYNAEGSQRAAVRESIAPEQHEAFDALDRFQTLQMSQSDGAQHERLRTVAHRTFTPKRISALKDAAQSYTDEIIAEMMEHEVADAMELAYRLPLMVICDLLEIPHGDREMIHEWSAKYVLKLDSGVDALMASHGAMQDFRAYVDAMVEANRRSPGSSPLIAAFVDAEDSEQLSSAELAANLMLLLFAGHETTTNLIAIGLLELLRRPEQWEALCRNPDIAPAATEELLRFVSPVQWDLRVALDGAEVANVGIAPGRTVAVMIACANRDPEVFSHPEQLDIERDDVGSQLAFGVGPHFCLGASLARLEGAIAFKALATRFPGMELDGTDLEWEGTAFLRRLKRLPVRLGAPSSTTLVDRTKAAVTPQEPAQ